jgi:predicted cation transporter
MLGLLIVLILVLFLPFTVKKVEHNLEIFLFIMGVMAASMSGLMDRELIEKALADPLKITAAVLLAGLICKWLQEPLENLILSLTKFLSPRVFCAITVIILGLASSIITAIIAAIVLVIIINTLPLDRKSEIRFTILACFSIGLGAALTPIGEPLSTVTVSKLNEDFFYLLSLIGSEIIPAILIYGVLTFFLVNPRNRKNSSLQSVNKVESYPEIMFRSFKVYLFVMGLTFLGAGFEPLINEYILGMQPILLYWINMISAVLDNATLAAAEISPAMSEETIRAILLGLLISGGMLIPGNIPNIIAAGKLNITSKEWAQFGVPVGLITMTAYFILLFILT